MNQEDQIGIFYEKVRQAVEYAKNELMLPYASYIGTLELVKFEEALECLEIEPQLMEDIEDDEEDYEDGDSWKDHADD